MKMELFASRPLFCITGRIGLIPRSGSANAGPAQTAAAKAIDRILFMFFPPARERTRERMSVCKRRVWEKRGSVPTCAYALRSPLRRLWRPAHQLDEHRQILSPGDDDALRCDQRRRDLRCRSRDIVCT